jgi:hypothetical protein
MAKRGRPPNDDVADDVKASIVQLIKQSLLQSSEKKRGVPKMDEQIVPEIKAELKKQGRRKNWRALRRMGRSKIYEYLKRFEDNQNYPHHSKKPKDGSGLE